VIKTAFVWLLRLLALRWLVRWLFPETGLDPCAHSDDRDDPVEVDDLSDEDWLHAALVDDPMTDALEVSLASDDLDLLICP
jgi:hypothetical protein